MALKRKQTLSTAQKESIILSISSYLEKHYSNIIAAYLFGSFISSTSYFSDIDLALLSETDVSKPLELELQLESQLEKIVNFPVDSRVLNNAPLSFCQNVIRGGRVVLDRNPNLRSEFEGKVLKQYFDFSRFRRRYLAGVENAPV